LVFIGVYRRLSAAQLPFLALLVFLLLWATAVRACPGDADERLPPAGELGALERELAQRAAECSRHAGYLAYHGAVLNALGRPAEAAVLLEQALLLDPQRAGAQIEYAAALAAVGDSASAATLLRDVLERPDVPVALRAELERRLNAIDVLRRQDALTGFSSWRKRAGAGWESAASLTFKVGRDTNLNSAPAHNVLTLTLPEGNALLLLADRFRPRAGSAALLEASGQLVRAAGGGAALQLYGEARVRESPTTADTNYHQLQAGGAWSQPLTSGSALFGAAASELVYDGNALYRAVRFSASRDWQANHCRPSLGLEGEWRRYPVARELDGRFSALSGGAVCSFGADRLALRVRGGRDAAQTNRAGGDQNQFDARLVWARPLGGGGLRADLLWYHQQDSSGYSPLLENGAARRLDRASAYLEYAYPVAAGWSVVASVEGLTQRSNLALFDISGRAFYLGVRWTK